MRAGTRCVELGSGMGLVGLVMARLGANVFLTDKASMLSVLRTNIAKNWLAPGSQRCFTCPRVLSLDMHGTMALHFP